MRIYLDAVVIIYAVERIEPWAQSIWARLASREIAPVTSLLSCLECKVRPLRFGHADVVARFDAFFADAADELLPVCGHGTLF